MGKQKALFTLFHPSRLSKKRYGFTLLELLIIIGVLAVMTMVVAPSFNAISQIQVSLATEDTLRLIRYARNMALQTQTPIHVTFTENCISVEAPESEKKLTYTTAEIKDPEDEDLQEEVTPSEKQSTVNQTATTQHLPNRLETHGFDTIEITKYYQEVNFKFVEYNDLIQRNSSDHGNFERRIDLDAQPEVVDEEGVTSFTLIVRANGTMRPCTMRVLPGDTDTADRKGGNTITFDFLCTGKIDE